MSIVWQHFPSLRDDFGHPRTAQRLSNPWRSLRGVERDGWSPGLQHHLDEDRVVLRATHRIDAGNMATDIVLNRLEELLVVVNDVTEQWSADLARGASVQDL